MPIMLPSGQKLSECNTKVIKGIIKFAVKFSISLLHRTYTNTHAHVDTRARARAQVYVGVKEKF